MRKSGAYGPAVAILRAHPGRIITPRILCHLGGLRRDQADHALTFAITKGYARRIARGLAVVLHPRCRR